MVMDVSMCTVQVCPAAGLLHPAAVPGSQSPLFLGHMGPQSCSSIPAGTDALTALHWHTHTARPLGSLLELGLATAHAEAALGYHSPLPPTSHPETHTPMPTHPRESLTQEKS